jgi:hypothetical protein
MKGSLRSYFHHIALIKKIFSKTILIALAFIAVNLFSFNTAFASKRKVTGVTYGSQTGTASAGTGTSVTYTISLNESSSFFGSTNNDDISISWPSGVPAGVTWKFTSSTESISGSTSSSPSFTPSGNDATITLTITTTSATPGGTFNFNLSVTDNNTFTTPTWPSSGLTLVVANAMPTISYSGSPYTYYAGTAISSLTPAVTNSPTSYSISPALPAGLSLNTLTGVISGTPTAASAATTYTVTATNASGSGNTTINITVLSPTISYAGSPYTYLTGVTISSLTPAVTGSPSGYSISPALPAGLSFDTSTGVISGTPTAVSAAAAYTITATYAGGVTATTTINITVNLSPPAISYSPSINVYTTGVAISALNPTNSGGAATGWSISPGLPAGLSFNTTTGIISGTPTATSAITTYTVTATNSGGSGTTTIKITVNPPAPIISYNTPNVYVVGNTIASLSPTNTGGAATSWSISPALPLGLSFNTGTGVITGTPLAASTAKTYTITATNGGGTGSTTVSIEVDLLGPTFIYPSPIPVYVVGTTITPLAPIILTGNPTSYSISAPLPAGLSFDTTTGIISGTPTATLPATTYTITASNGGGSGTALIVLIVVNPLPPNISYIPSSNNYTVGTTITTWTPLNIGGPVASWSISPALPAGLSFNTSTGAITGTPTAISATTTYTVTATNAGGSGTTTITITVNPVPPSISYSPSANTYIVGTAISSWSPTNTGGAATSWAISPALPAGLSFNTGTGVITGTPTAVSSSTTYTVTATNAGGSGTCTITITVNPQAPVISYTPSANIYTVNSAITAWSPTNTGGAATSWSISPALPAGLSLNTSTGVISGTPTAIATIASYTVTATNVTGSGSCTITITVNPIAPNISYSPSTATYTVGTAITALTPTNTGGSSTNWAIGPALPAGLSFNTTTGQITGTPTVTSSATTYSISADNDGGTSVTYVTISCVNPTLPAISYTPSTNTYIVGTAIAPLTPTNTGGAANSYSINTPLPAGLSFNTTTGVISGTPTSTSSATTYTITATNAAGSTNTTVTLTVNNQAPNISYTPSTNTYSVGATITSLTPANTGGAATSWSINTALPAGLSFDTSTGIISGTPTAISATKTYTITASNVTGSSSTTVTITVNNSKPNISYSPGTVSYAVGGTITPAMPTNTGGAASSWSISGTLPTGLSFDTGTGIISGTPTAVFSTSTFTIKATNSAGSSSTNLIITVSPHAPIISYTPSTVALTLNAAMTTMTPTNTGGAVTGYSYSSTGVSLTGASLGGPSLMWIDASGNIYVANYNKGTVSRWNSSHTYLGTYGSGKSLSNPEGVVFDSAGNYYIEDTGAGAVYKYNSSGVYQSTIISGLNHPLGISIDPSDNLYIATYVYTSPYTSSVTKYSTSGVLLQTISNTQMDQSDGVAVDGSGNIYVLNRAQDQAGTNKGYVTKYNSAGVYQGIFSSGYEDPLAISCDPSGNVFVADSHNNQVKIYSPSGVLLNTISGFNDVEGFVADGNGNLYVSDFSNNTVKEYSALGGYYISAPLPAGLSFNTSTGQITGTPTVTFAPTTYTITAYNITGSGSTTVTLSCTQSNDWTGTTSTDWNTASNWLSNAVPTSTQSALIGVNRSFTNYPNVSASDGTVNVGSVQFGNQGGKAPGIVVNSGGVLNVLGALTYQSDASSASGYTGTLSGAGTLNAGSIAVVSNTTLTSSYTSVLASSLTNLNVSGNISLTTSNSGSNIFNSTFNVTGGTTTLTGYLQTTNTASGTSTFAIVPSSTATLQLVNSSALSGLSATGTNVVTFNNIGATVQYSGAAQTVYTSAAITGLASGVSYYSIAFSGTGIKTASTNNLNISGNFTNSMANDASNYVNLSSPIINFNGTTQALAGGPGNGTTFYNVTFSGNGTKTMSSGAFYVATTGVLTMSGSSASTILNANGILTLKSDASSSASVAAISSGPGITGNVNVQRYVTGGAGYRGYRLASSPVHTAIVGSNNVYSINYLQNSIYLTGSAGGGFDKTGNPTIYLFREDLTPSNLTFISGNWWGISAINNATQYNYLVAGQSASGTFNIPSGNGYLFFYRGNRASASLATETTTTYTTPASVTMTATGVLNQGQITFRDWYTPTSDYLGYTGSGTGTNSAVRGFNMAGNPYASSIDWELFNNTTSTSGIYGNNVSTTIYEFNPGTQNYDTYQKGGIYTNHGRRVIVSGEGFFVLATNNSSPQLIFNESAKTTTQSTGLNLFMSAGKHLANLDNTPDEHLRLQMEMDSINTDDTYIGFSQAARSQYVIDEDAPYKAGNGKIGLASFSSDDIQMAINKMPLPAQGKMVIPLSVTARAQGLYKLNMTEIQSIPQIYEIWLMDNYKKDSLDMRTYSTYAFNITSDTASMGNNRFKLVIRENTALMVHLLNFTAVKTGQGSQINWLTENEQNYTNFTVERSTDGGKNYTVIGGIAASGLGNYGILDSSPVKGSDTYRLATQDLNGNITYSNTITLMYGNNAGSPASSNIAIYPNPTSGPITLNIKPLSNTASPVYNIKIANATGLIVKSGKSTLQSWQANVSSLQPGSYMVQVLDNNNNLVGRGTFIKL